MYPYFHIIIPSYTVMAALGSFFALGLIFARLDKYHIPFSSFLQMTFFTALASFFGAKILFAFTQIPWLIHHFSFSNLLLLIPRSGLVFYGGLFGALGSLLWFTRKDMEYRKRVFHLCVPAIPLFHAFGRIGCFLTGCCYGKKLSHTFRIGFFIFDQIPVQLIESAAEFTLFVVLSLINYKSDKINQAAGQSVDLLKWYLNLYAIFRFIIEFFRGDRIRGIFFGLSTSQWISLIILCLYCFTAVRQKLRNGKVRFFS